MEIRGAASSALQDLLDGPPRPVRVLGAGPLAVYLQCEQQVLAVVAAAAVRLPCALVVPLAPPRPIADRGAVGSSTVGGGTVGGGAVRWRSATGPVAIIATRYWRPSRVRASTVAADALRAALVDAVTGVDDELVEALGPNSVAAVRALLGRGPGLTPAGDDVLAGFVLGARAFGLAIAPVRAAVERAAGRTSALSAQLLRHALAGECAPQVLPALAKAELGPLLRVGHTSGAALARGLLRAAELRDDLVAAA
jgi:hypothetical protein